MNGQPAIVPTVSEHQSVGSGSVEAGDAVESAAAPRRMPGEPHPYMLQRNPPNLWILAAMTVFSLALAVLVLAVTVLL